MQPKKSGKLGLLERVAQGVKADNEIVVEVCENGKRCAAQRAEGNLRAEDFESRPGVARQTGA